MTAVVGMWAIETNFARIVAIVEKIILENRRKDNHFRRNY